MDDSMGYIQQYKDNKGRKFLSVIAQREPNTCVHTPDLIMANEDVITNNFVKQLRQTESLILLGTLL